MQCTFKIFNKQALDGLDIGNCNLGYVVRGMVEVWFPYHPVSVLFTSAGISFVEIQLIDQEDEMSEWTY